jgi:alkanesulfonate monooxygenase SsuD/methylene tetrahydromethanopterin reductase-like flavin-dependent oxidoreductase (luciferase family)
MGVGRGYHTREVETFGAPLIDADKNREYFEEQLQLMLACFNQEHVAFKGKYFTCPPEVEYRGYQLKDITMVPRPKHLPVEVWMPVASGKTIDMMAKYGLKAMVTLNGEKILDDVVRAYQAACAKHGAEKQLGQDMCWGTGLYLAGSQEEAIRRVEPAHDERYKCRAQRAPELDLEPKSSAMERHFPRGAHPVAHRSGLLGSRAAALRRAGGGLRFQVRIGGGL